MNPLLVCMHSKRPGRALFPLPTGSAGHKLWAMLNKRTGASMDQYRHAFERHHLVRNEGRDMMQAQAKAYEIVCDLSHTGRTVVLLGNSVRSVFDTVTGGNLPPVLIHPQETGGIWFRQIPHPVVATTWYNELDNQKLVELLMEELYVGSRSTRSLEKV